MPCSVHETAAIIAEHSGAREALAVLREIEWSGSDSGFVCPRCGHHEDESHSSDCGLAAARAKLEGK